MVRPSALNLSPALHVRDLGLRPYADSFEAMRGFTVSRDASTQDELWLLEHPPVFTQGLNGQATHLLSPGEIPVVATDRGGQVTYHGPGQLIAYLLFDLGRARLGVRDTVEHLEQAVIGLLDECGIRSVSKRDAPGVYVDDAKIASLGLKVRAGRCYHGLALNVAMDLAPFERINPCGYAGLRMCQVSDFAPGMSVDVLKPRLAHHLAERLGLEPVFLDSE